MSSLLELRDKIKYYYSEYEFIVLPALKFMLAYLTICCVNGGLGYMAEIDTVGVVLIASLVCSFMPVGFIAFIACLFSLLHMYALSVETALVGVCIYLVVLLMFMRFDSKNVLAAIATAICAAMGIPYVMPVAVGLLAAPSAGISVGCGLVVHALIKVVSANAAVINGMGSGEEIAKVRLILDGLLNDRALHVMIVAFAITVIVVYMVRRMKVDYSWTIAMVTGAIVNIVVLLVGDLVYDTQVSLGGAFLASVLALAVGKVLEFMFFCVDYSRTENVQFEDDEYYYYVKAVPKMSVAVSSKTVKKINTQRSSRSQAYQRSGGSRGQTYQRSSSRYEQGGTSSARGTGGQSEYAQKNYGAQRNPYLNKSSQGGKKSVTMSNTEYSLDFDEIQNYDE